jgi:predicted glycosyltransferase
MTPRVLFHVQHLLGTGHLRRAAAIAASMVRQGFRVELVSGGPPLVGLDIGEARLTQLPPLRATDASFRALVDARGRPIDDAWRATRRDALLDLFARVEPNVLVTELFPLGRRNLSFELVPLIEAARARPSPPLIVASVRDVLARKTDSRKTDEMVARALAWYDRILVHGDPNLIALGASFPDSRLGALIDYTGYVGTGATPAPPPGDGEDEIIVSAGGGAVGERLLKTAIAARPLSREGHRRWRVLMGPNVAAQAGLELARSAGPGCMVEPARADFPGLLARCHVSVSQAGYNTVMDVLTARARPVLVPFAGAGETEQALRADALASRGWAQIVPEDALSPVSLAAAVDRAARAPRPPADGVRRDGAVATGHLIQRLLTERSDRA